MNFYQMARAAFRFIGVCLILYSLYAFLAQVIFGPGMLGEPGVFGDGPGLGDFARNPLVRVAMWYFALNFFTGVFLIAASAPLARIVGRSDDEAWKQ